MLGKAGDREQPRPLLLCHPRCRVTHNPRVGPGGHLEPVKIEERDQECHVVKRWPKLLGMLAPSLGSPPTNSRFLTPCGEPPRRCNGDPSSVATWPETPIHRASESWKPTDIEKPEAVMSASFRGPELRTGATCPRQHALYAKSPHLQATRASRVA